MDEMDNMNEVAASFMPDEGMDTGDLPSRDGLTEGTPGDEHTNHPHEELNLKLTSSSSLSDMGLYQDSDEALRTMYALDTDTGEFMEQDQTIGMVKPEVKPAQDGDVMSDITAFYNEEYQCPDPTSQAEAAHVDTDQGVTVIAPMGYPMGKLDPGDGATPVQLFTTSALREDQQSGYDVDDDVTLGPQDVFPGEMLPLVDSDGQSDAPLGGVGAPGPLIRCPPSCRSNCASKHHPLLVAILNCVDNEDFSIMDCKLNILKSVVNKYEMRTEWRCDDPIPDTVPGYRFPMIHWACSLGRVGVVVWLAGYGVKTTTRAANSMAETGLHRALLSLQATCPKLASNKFKQLLSVMEPALKVQDREGNTPIHLCCEMLKNDMPHADFYGDCLDYMMKRVFNFWRRAELCRVLNLQNVDGDTALHLLCATPKHVESVGILMEHGADCHIKNNKGDTALRVAAKGDNMDVKHFLQQWKRTDIRGSMVDGGTIVVRQMEDKDPRSQSPPSVSQPVTLTPGTLTPVTLLQGQAQESVTVTSANAGTFVFLKPSVPRYALQRVDSPAQPANAVTSHPLSAPGGQTGGANLQDGGASTLDGGLEGEDGGIPPGAAVVATDPKLVRTVDHITKCTSALLDILVPVEDGSHDDLESRLTQALEKDDEFLVTRMTEGLTGYKSPVDILLRVLPNNNTSLQCLQSINAGLKVLGDPTKAVTVSLGLLHQEEQALFKEIRVLEDGIQKAKSIQESSWTRLQNADEAISILSQVEEADDMEWEEKEMARMAAEAGRVGSRGGGVGGEGDGTDGR